MLEDVANTTIPASSGEQTILVFVVKLNSLSDAKLPVVILVHDVYGLTPEICRHNYVVWKLCGAFVTDTTTTSTTGLLDLSFQYAKDMINSVELGHWMEKLPPIKAANLLCGCLRRDCGSKVSQLRSLKPTRVVLPCVEEDQKKGIFDTILQN